MSPIIPEKAKCEQNEFIRDALDAGASQERGRIVKLNRLDRLYPVVVQGTSHQERNRACCDSQQIILNHKSSKPSAYSYTCVVPSFCFGVAAREQDGMVQFFSLSHKKTVKTDCISVLLYQ